MLAFASAAGRASMRSAVMGLGVGVGIGRGATLCSVRFDKLKIANAPVQPPAPSQ